MVEFHKLPQQLGVLYVDLFDLQHFLLQRFVFFQKCLLLGLAQKGLHGVALSVCEGSLEACGEHPNALGAVFSVHLNIKKQLETMGCSIIASLKTGLDSRSWGSAE